MRKRAVRSVGASGGAGGWRLSLGARAEYTEDFVEFCSSWEEGEGEDGEGFLLLSPSSSFFLLFLSFLIGENNEMNFFFFFICPSNLIPRFPFFTKIK